MEQERLYPGIRARKVKFFGDMIAVPEDQIQRAIAGPILIRVRARGGWLVAPAWRIREFGVRMRIEGRTWWALEEARWTKIEDGKEDGE
jgi:hypothetical protein